MSYQLSEGTFFVLVVKTLLQLENVTGILA